MRNYSNAESLSLAIGRQLNKVFALTFGCNEDLENSLVEEISLEFEGLRAVRIFCGVDGSSICWDNRDLLPIDMGKDGKLTISIISEHDELWKSLLNQRLKKVCLVISEIEKCIFALKFIFSNGLELVIANIGDDLMFRQQLPLQIIEEEKARFVDIQEIIRWPV